VMMIFVNVHAPTEIKSEDTSFRFYEEVERACNQFSKYHVKSLLRDFNERVGKQDIFKLTISI
jgi:hypothetical protein